MLKVLYMLPAEKFGGAERQGLMAIKNLPTYDINVVTLTGPGKIITEKLEEEGIKDYIYADFFPDDPKHPLTSFETVKRWYYNLDCFIKSKKTVKEILSKNPCDLLYATRTFSWIVAGFVSKETGIPTVWRCGSRLTNNFQRFLLKYFISWTNPASLILNCNAMKESLGHNINVPTFIVQHSIDTQRFNTSIPGEAFKSHFGLPKNVKLIGVSARPAPEKGPAFVASILKELCKMNKNILLIWAGESSWRNHLEELFRKEGLQESVKFLGHIQRIEEFYAACDVIILASKPISIETTPNSLLEPMAMKKPVVATYAGGIPELITNGENGYLEEYGDALGFASTINKILSDDALCKRIGEAARKRIEKFHSENTNVKLLADIFKDLVKKSR